MDPDLEAKHRLGRTMITIGIFVMVASFFVACGAAMSRDHHNAFANGQELGQSAWFTLPFFGGLALIVLGQVRKTNANNAQKTRIERQAMKTELVPTENVPGGPFRGALEEVHTPDPALVAADEAEYARRKARGGTYLLIGGAVMALTAVWMVHSITSTHRFDENIMTIGLAFFPFGGGLAFAIRGAVLRARP